MQTKLERRQGIATALKALRAYRKEHSQCRECGEPLGDQDKTRCFNCKTYHATRAALLYQRKKEKAHAGK